jgi:O-succinylbenzoic acid--CoA ligase
LDDVINSGGIKIHPVAVERDLASTIDGPFKCYGEPHPKWGQALVLRIHAACEPANASAERERITAWAQTNLPPYRAPKRIEWMPLETTASGKWKRPRT